MQLFDKLVGFEKLGAAHGLSTKGHVFEGEIAEAGIALTPEKLRLTKNAGSGDADVLKVNPRHITSG